MKLFKKRPKPHKKTYDEVSYDNCADSEPLKIVEVVNQTYPFIPTNSKWRLAKCCLLNIPPPKIPLKKYCDIRRKKLHLGTLFKVDNIEGNGNCLFRALSQ